MNTTAPTSCPSWPRLATHAESWAGTRTAELFASDAARASSLMAAAPGMRYEYARQRVNALTLRLLTQLAQERGLAEWRDSMLAGRKVNTTENRAAAHVGLVKDRRVVRLPGHLRCPKPSGKPSPWP